jgi:PEP-CTERM motif
MNVLDSTISNSLMSAANGSIDLTNSTLTGSSLSLNNYGKLELENTTISGGSLALSGSSTVLADGGTSDVALSIVDPGRLTVIPDAMLQILQDNETCGTTTVDGTLQALNGLSVTRGTLSGSGVIIGNLMLAGVLKPGDSGPGSIAIQGNYAEARSGVLDEELASPSQFDSTDITQSAALGGTLDIHLSDGFTPVMGETFQIMDFASSTGTFDNVLGEYIGDGEKFDVIYNPTNITLEVVPIGATPEPGSLFLFGSGVIGLSAFLRKRLHKTA